MENEKTHKINSFLSFTIGEEFYAANASYVINILEMTKITKIPMAPTYMLGVINLRGTVLPLVDARIKFGLPSVDSTSNTCILVLEITIDKTKVHTGLVVDSVQEVLEIEEAEIQPTPSIGGKYKSEFIDGVYRQDNDEFIMILNMDIVFSMDELIGLKKVTKEIKKEEINEVKKVKHVVK